MPYFLHWKTREFSCSRRKKESCVNHKIETTILAGIVETSIRIRDWRVKKKILPLTDRKGDSNWKGDYDKQSTKKREWIIIP